MRISKKIQLITISLLLAAITFGPTSALRRAHAVRYTQTTQSQQASSLSNNPVAAVAPYPRHSSRESLKWADGELSRMTLDEKIGQLVSVGINATFLNQESAEYRALRHQIEDNHVGGLILFQSPVYEAVHLLNRMQALARYPLLVSADLERGPAMRFDDVVDFGWIMAVGATGKIGRAHV